GAPSVALGVAGSLRRLLRLRSLRLRPGGRDGAAAGERLPARGRRPWRPAGEEAMRFAWTDDQLAFRDAAQDLFAKGAEWSDLEGMGITSVLVPEARGGLGLDECSLVPVLEEAGRVAL